MGAYNYIIYGTGFEDYQEPMWSTLRDDPEIRIVEHGITGSRLIRRLFDFHWSHKVNALFRLPFKQIWFKKMTNYSFPEEKPICFVFVEGKYLSQSMELAEYLKKLNPQNRRAIVFMDLVRSGQSHPEADLTLSYDRGQCDRFGYTYYDMSLYSTLMPVTMPETFDYDAFFIGFAKNRLDDIHAVYRTLSAAGLRTRFMVVGVKPEQRIEGEGLEYLEKPISYREVISILQRTRCIVELTQANATGHTLRTLEAIAYRRKMLFNRPVEALGDFYCPENMQGFTNPAEIDLDFLRTPVNYAVYEGWRAGRSAEEFKAFMEQKLNPAK